MISELMAECFGTVLFFSCILSYGEPIPIVVGLLAAIYAFGKVSGGHFNGTVSFLMFLKGDIKFDKLVLYIIAQAVGAIIALAWWKNVKSIKN